MSTIVVKMTVAENSVIKKQVSFRIETNKENGGAPTETRRIISQMRNLVANGNLLSVTVSINECEENFAVDASSVRSPEEARISAFCSALEYIKRMISQD